MADRAAGRLAAQINLARALIAAPATPRRPRIRRGPAGRLVPPRAVVRQPAELARLGIGRDGEHRPACPVAAALNDVGMCQGTAD